MRATGTAHAPCRTADPRVNLVLALTVETPTLHVTDLARACQLSPSRLSHLFKQCTDTPLGTYLCLCRLNYAEQLLVSTTQSIKAVSYFAGYKHTSSFLRAFKSHFGKSPLQYRRGRLFPVDDAQP